MAFSVVLSTLVLQGLTLTPLTRTLKLNRADVTKQELAEAQARLATAALSALATQTGSEVESVRYPYVIQRAATDSDPGLQALRKTRELGLAAIAVEREELETLR
jgi:NhaP-type Na+/H+ or K+/H+ antiporter